MNNNLLSRELLIANDPNNVQNEIKITEKRQSSNQYPQQQEIPNKPPELQQIEYEKMQNYSEYEQQQIINQVNNAVPEFKPSSILDKNLQQQIEEGPCDAGIIQTENKVKEISNDQKNQIKIETTNEKITESNQYRNYLNTEKNELTHKASIQKGVVSPVNSHPSSPKLSANNQIGSSDVLKDIASPSHGTKSMKLGVELFINLKQGSTSKFYTTGEVLGQGSFGKVWKVTHKTTGLVRAMKQLKKSALLQEEEQRLFSEMNILKNLDHPHIVKLYELYQDQSNYYLITEYLSGGELFERIKQINSFTERFAAHLMRQILQAVVYCHEQNIVHRDLKPENIIFATQDKDSPIKIIDFGTSRKFTNQKNMRKTLGTPYYIAPEVLKQNYNEKCDVWSCGVILYIFLSGYPPFTGRSEKEIFDKVRAGKFKYDPTEWDSISQEAKSLINRMLTLDYNHRISAKQALNDPWMQKHGPNIEINKKVLQNLSAFQVIQCQLISQKAESLFKQAILSYIVSQMSTQQDIEDLQKTFKSLDKNNDGILSREELIEGYTSLVRNKAKATEEVDRILALVDINQSGKVDFSEFLMAAMNQEKIISVKKVEQAFKIFDQDGDGFISKKEIEYIMGQINTEQWNRFLFETDKNNDGKISLEEFKKVLLTKNVI